jgi:hypothetical protein
MIDGGIGCGALERFTCFGDWDFVSINTKISLFVAAEMSSSFAQGTDR